MKKRVVSIITSVFLLMTIFAVPTFAAEQYQPKADSYTWTEWSTSAPPSGADYETKTQYRYRDKSYVTNGYYTYSGYTQSAIKLVSTSYGNWYLSARATSDTPGATYRTIVSNETKTAYFSYAYVCNCKSWFWKNSGGYHKGGDCPTKNQLKIYGAKRLSGTGYAYESSDGSYAASKTIGTTSPGKFGTIYLTTYKGDRVNSFTSNVGTTWLWKGGGDDTRKMYRAVTKKYQYTHWKWGAWSSYGDSYVSSSSNREVQTRTLYRYKVYDQTISGASTFNKTYGNSAFNLGASAKTGLTYSSSNTGIATVSSNGTVTLKSAGTVTITIKAAASSIYNGATKYVTINIAKGSPDLNYAGETTINKTYSTSTFSVAATSKSGVQYSSSNTDVLTVSTAGVVTLKKAGTAVITIKAPSNSKYNAESVKVTVNVTKAPQKITCAVANTVNKKYGNKAFNLGAKSKTKRTYTTSNKNVATVTSEGKVTIKNPGTATITIKAVSSGKYKAATKKIKINVGMKSPTLTIKQYKEKGVRKVKFTWTKPYGAHGYELYGYVPTLDASNVTTIKDENKKSRIITKFPEGVTYEYKIRAYRTVNGKKVYSAYSTVKTVYFEN